MANAKEIVEKIKKEAVNLGGIYYSVFEAIEALDLAKQAGLNVYIDFNGRKLYSLLDDSASCQQKVRGYVEEEIQPNQN